MKKAYLSMLPYLVFLTILFAWPATSATLRAHLSHVDSGRGFTKRELLRRMVVRSRARAANLCPYSGANAHPATAPVGRATTNGDTDINSEYLIHFSIGTPRSQPVALTLDTGSNVIWTQCYPCAECFHQPFPEFDTAASNTVRSVACSDPLCQGLEQNGCLLHGCIYVAGYGDGSRSFGHFVRDSFTFNGKGGAVTVPDLGFGCGISNTGRFLGTESGIAGFGGGASSLPSQLKVRKFSYCFTTRFEAKSSPVFLGTADDLKAHATGPIQSTPFVRNPPGASSFYFLSLKGVTVGETRLPVPESAFAIKANGSGGTIIDTGTDITAFPDAIFRHLKSAFVAQVPLPVNKSADEADICFSGLGDAKKPVPMPKLIFHLEGADWDLPRENYVTEDHKSGEVCVIISTLGDRDLTIIGNFQQQNIHIVYDLAASKLLLVPAECDKL